MMETRSSSCIRSGACMWMASSNANIALRHDIIVVMFIATLWSQTYSTKDARGRGTLEVGRLFGWLVVVIFGLAMVDPTMSAERITQLVIVLRRFSASQRTANTRWFREHPLQSVPMFPDPIPVFKAPLDHEFGIPRLDSILLGGEQILYYTHKKDLFDTISRTW